MFFSNNRLFYLPWFFSHSPTPSREVSVKLAAPGRVKFGSGDSLLFGPARNIDKGNEGGIPRVLAGPALRLKIDARGRREDPGCSYLYSCPGSGLLARYGLFGGLLSEIAREAWNKIGGLPGKKVWSVQRNFGLNKAFASARVCHFCPGYPSFPIRAIITIYEWSFIDSARGRMNCCG